MGYKRVVLLGVDANYTGRQQSVESGYDTEHFHPEYFDPKLFPEDTTQGHPDSESGTFLYELMTGRNLPNEFRTHAPTNMNTYDDELNKRRKRDRAILCDDTFEVVSATPDSRINHIMEYKPLKEWIE